MLKTIFGLFECCCFTQVSWYCSLGVFKISDSFGFVGICAGTILANTQDFCAYGICTYPYADISGKARGINFVLSLHLHLYRYFVYVSSEGFGEYMHTDWLVPM